MSVKVLADNGYTTVFHPYQEGVTVHNQGNVKITITKQTLLQGWYDEKELWHVPLVDKVTDLASQMIVLDQSAPSIAIHSIYKLPSTGKVMRYLHAALRYLTKSTLLTAVCKGF